MKVKVSFSIFLAIFITLLMYYIGYYKGQKDITHKLYTIYKDVPKELIANKGISDEELFDRLKYKYTETVQCLADKGWKLFKERELKGSYNEGYYTDPVPDDDGYEFWTDGIIAKVDRDSNGHHETIFCIVNGEVKYFGSIGGWGQWTDIIEEYKKNKGKRAVLMCAREYYEKHNKLESYNNRIQN